MPDDDDAHCCHLRWQQSFLLLLRTIRLPSRMTSDMNAFELPPPARRRQRLLAKLIDWCLFMVPLVPLYVLGALALMILTHGSGQLTATGWWTTQNQQTLHQLTQTGIVFWLALLPVNLLLFYRRGQTIGKWLMNIRIIRKDGARCSLTRFVFLRVIFVWVLECLPLAGLLLYIADPFFIFREDRRCLHDRIANTRVVQA